LRRRLLLEDEVPRRTGARFIASLTAIFDLDLHHRILDNLIAACRVGRRYSNGRHVIRHPRCWADKTQFRDPIEPATQRVDHGEPGLRRHAEANDADGEQQPSPKRRYWPDAFAARSIKRATSSGLDR
jgi:hypothetical protein